MPGFIRVAEVWVPAPVGDELILQHGVYGRLEAFKAASVDLRFSRGEGLPGRAWANRQPIILADLQNSYFKRAAAAAMAGIVCGIAMPFFYKETLMAVVVLFCGSSESTLGAIELWVDEGAEPGQMTLRDGYYGSAELSQWTEQQITFAKGFDLRVTHWPARLERGSGLAALVGQSGTAEVLNDPLSAWGIPPPTAPSIHAISLGIGIPLFCDPVRTWIVTMLSAPVTPIARRVEVWNSQSEAEPLETVRAVGSDVKIVGDHNMPTRAAIQEGLIGPVAASRRPNLVETTTMLSSQLKEPLQSEGLAMAMVFPIIARDGTLRSVIALFS
jgi:GAF domain